MPASIKSLASLFLMNSVLRKTHKGNSQTDFLLRANSISLSISRTHTKNCRSISFRTKIKFNAVFVCTGFEAVTTFKQQREKIQADIYPKFLWDTSFTFYVIILIFWSVFVLPDLDSISHIVSTPNRKNNNAQATLKRYQHPMMATPGGCAA